MLAVNRELVLLYWRLGRDILERQEQAGWGGKIIDRLAQDLHAEFPEMKGFSRTNLLYMRAFGAAWPDESIVQQLVGQIPWGHHCILLDKVKTVQEREWYIRQTTEHGWSRSVLGFHIERSLYNRQGKALSNFNQTLPAPQSDLVQQLLKDPYNFDFLTLGSEAKERDLERALVQHMRDFLLELGDGFAFVGQQYPIEVGDQDFRIDLLFYHLRLRCYVVIELKLTPFMPEYAGKMNFYLAVVDDLLRHSSDAPTIGLILCKTPNKVVVEYALRDNRNPIGVSEFRLTTALPEELKGTLPSIESLEEELQDKAV